MAKVKQQPKAKKLPKHLRLSYKSVQHLMVAPDRYMTGVDRTVDYYAKLERDNKAKPLPVPVPLLIEKPLISALQASEFYASREWEKLRDAVLHKYGKRCMCCGDQDRPVHVDHIKPLRRYWELRLKFYNMQVLCEVCNLMKGNWSETDFRKRDRNLRRRYLRKEAFYDDRLTQQMQQLVNLALKRE